MSWWSLFINPPPHQDKCNPPSWAAAQLTGRACGPQGGLLITSGHRSWVWHVLKWVGERLLEEMSSNRLTAAGPELGPTAAGGSGSESGRGRRSRGSSSGNGDTSHGTCGVSAPAGGTGSSDPQVMLWQLVQRTGSFRGPELLPLACTLLEVVAHGKGGTACWNAGHLAYGEAGWLRGGRLWLRHLQFSTPTLSLLEGGSDP